MRIMNITRAVGNVTLATDEVWQARGGVLMVDTEADPAEREGLLLRDGDTIGFSAGMTVYYWNGGSANVHAVRVAV